MRKKTVPYCLAAACVLLAGYAAQAQTLSNTTLLQKGRVDAPISTLAAPLSQSFLETFKLAVPKKGEADTRGIDELANWQAAARYARDNQSDFARLLEMHTRFGGLIPIGRDAEHKSLQYLAYTVLALQPQAELDKYYKENGINDAVIITAIQNEVNALKAMVRKLTNPTITVFATGNIRSLATSKSPEPTATGTGSIGATYASSKKILSAQFNVASTADTAKGEFGSQLLAPLNGKSLKSAAVEWYQKLPWSASSWMHAYGNFTGSLWEIQKDSLYKNASIVGLGLLYHHRLFEGMVAETEIGLAGELGLSARWLNGDIRNLLDEEKGREKYLAAFPSEKRLFYGLEGGLSLNFGQIVGAMQAYYLFKKKREPVDGLTNLQLSVGLSVRGDVFRGFLSPREN